VVVSQTQGLNLFKGCLQPAQGKKPYLPKAALIVLLTKAFTGINYPMLLLPGHP